MRLVFRTRPTPKLDVMSELLRAQLGPLYDQAVNDGGDGSELIALFDVLDERGAHVFDLHLFCGDDGRLHRKGTLEHVASFSQGGATGTDDEAMIEALDAAYAEWRTAERARRAGAPKKSAPKKSAPKKSAPKKSAPKKRTSRT